MNTNHQTTGGFLRSSALSLLILANLLFSVFFLMSLSSHVMSARNKPKPASVAKKAEPKTHSILTLANIQQ